MLRKQQIGFLTILLLLLVRQAMMPLYLMEEGVSSLDIFFGILRYEIFICSTDSHGQAQISKLLCLLHTFTEAVIDVDIILQSLAKVLNFCYLIIQCHPQNFCCL